MVTDFLSDKHPNAPLKLMKRVLTAAQELRADILRAAADPKDLGDSGRLDLLRAFELFDMNGNGSIDRAEFNAILVELDVGSHLVMSQRIALLDLLDRNRTGVIEFDEFEAFAMGRPEAALRPVAVCAQQLRKYLTKFDTREDNMYLAVTDGERFGKDFSFASVFRRLDATGDGRVGLGTFKRALQRIGLGRELSPRQMRDLHRLIDVEGRGWFDIYDLEYFVRREPGSLHDTPGAAVGSQPGASATGHGAPGRTSFQATRRVTANQRRVAVTRRRATFASTPEGRVARAAAELRAQMVGHARPEGPTARPQDYDATNPHDNPRDLRSPPTARHDWRRSFDLFDVDGNGRISPEDLRAVLSELGIGQDLRNAGHLALMRRLDRDGKGYFDLDDFIRFAQAKDSALGQGAPTLHRQHGPCDNHCLRFVRRVAWRTV